MSTPHLTPQLLAISFISRASRQGQQLMKALKVNKFFATRVASIVWLTNSAWSHAPAVSQALTQALEVTVLPRTRRSAMERNLRPSELHLENF